jgi:hypothetical protein
MNKFFLPIFLIALILLFLGCTQPSYCGDGFCSAFEDQYNCSADCGSPIYKLGDYTFVNSTAYIEDSSFLQQVITYNTDFDRLGEGVGYSTNNTIGDSFNILVQEGEVIIKSVSADCKSDELYAVIMNTNNVSRNYKKGDQVKTDTGIIQIEDIYHSYTRNASCIKFNYLDVNKVANTICVGEVESNIVLTDVRVPQSNCTNVKTLFRVVGNANTIDFVLNEEMNLYTASMFNDKQTFLQLGDNYPLEEGYLQVTDIVYTSNNELRVKITFFSSNGTAIKIAEIREGEEFATKLLVKNIFNGLNSVNGIIIKRLD